MGRIGGDETINKIYGMKKSIFHKRKKNAITFNLSLFSRPIDEVQFPITVTEKKMPKTVAAEDCWSIMP